MSHDFCIKSKRLKGFHILPIALESSDTVKIFKNLLQRQREYTN